MVTRDPGWSAAGADRAGSLEEALAAAAAAAHVFVIGGGTIYAEALPLADELHLTEIGLDVDGDTFFPEWAREEFEERSREERVSREGTRYAFVTYARA